MTVPSAAGSEEGRKTLSKWLFNPFYFIAGGQSLAIGMVILFITGMLGYFGKFRFDGLLDFHMGVAPPPFWLSISEHLISWLLLSVLLLVSAKLISKSSIRIIDVFGTQALARFPHLITALAAMLPGARTFAQKLVFAQTMPQEFSMELLAFAFAALISLVMLIWMIVLMYRAFATSCNVSGAKAVMVFILCIITGEVLSKIILFQIERMAL